MLEKKRIAVIGSGAVGGYYGARLAQAGHDVHFLARRDYLIGFVVGLDLFPQTYHFETVVRLTRR